MDDLHFVGISLGGLSVFVLVLLALYIIGRVITAGVMRSIQQARRVALAEEAKVTAKEHHRGF